MLGILKHAICFFFQWLEIFNAPWCTKCRVEAWHPYRAQCLHSKQLLCWSIGLSCSVKLWCNDTFSVHYVLHSPENLTCLSTSVHCCLPLALRHMHLHICSPTQAAAKLFILSPPSPASEIISTLSVLGSEEEIFVPFFFHLLVFVCFNAFHTLLDWGQINIARAETELPADQEHPREPVFCRDCYFLMSVIMSWGSIRLPWLHKKFGNTAFTNTG